MRGAAEAFLRLDESGVALRVDGERLVAWPETLMTDELRALVKAHRRELVGLLLDAEAQAAVATLNAACSSADFVRMMRGAPPTRMQTFPDLARGSA